LQYINIAIVILIVNFDFLDGKFLGFLPILDGEFEDFTVQWYSQVGKTLCFTLFINIFSPHASKLTLPFIKVFQRCLDRGCSFKLKKEQDMEDITDTDVNTKKLLQEEVNELYTGFQISSHYVYA